MFFPGFVFFMGPTAKCLHHTFCPSSPKVHSLYVMKIRYLLSGLERPLLHKTGEQNIVTLFHSLAGSQSTVSNPTSISIISKTSMECLFTSHFFSRERLLIPECSKSSYLYWQSPTLGARNVVV